MVYRLVFDLTSDGYLRVTGAAKDLPEVSAIYLNDEVFGASVRAAQIAPFSNASTFGSCKRGANSTGNDICCEAVELSQKQIDLLCLPFRQEPNGLSVTRNDMHAGRSGTGGWLPKGVWGCSQQDYDASVRHRSPSNDPCKALNFMRLEWHCRTSNL